MVYAMQSSVFTIMKIKERKKKKLIHFKSLFINFILYLNQIISMPPLFVCVSDEFVVFLFHASIVQSSTAHSHCIFFFNSVFYSKVKIIRSMWITYFGYGFLLFHLFHFKLTMMNKLLIPTIRVSLCSLNGKNEFSFRLFCFLEV